MEVRVLAAPPSSGYPEQDYICVRTDTDPLDDTVVLATIERVTDRTKGKVKRVKTLLADLETMTAESADAEDYIDLGERTAFVPETMEGECSA